MAMQLENWLNGHSTSGKLVERPLDWWQIGCMPIPPVENSLNGQSTGGKLVESAICPVAKLIEKPIQLVEN